MIYTVKNMCIKNHKNLDPDGWIPYYTSPRESQPDINVKLRILCFTRRGTKRFSQPASTHEGWRHHTTKQSTAKGKCDGLANKKMKIKDFIYGTLPRRNKKSKKKVHDHVTTSKKRSRSRDLSNNNNNRGFFPIEHNRYLVSEDFQYKDNDFATCNISYQLESINGNNACLSQDTEPVFEQIRKESASVIYESSFDGQFNTLPKIRSRIKTNPWLPSPKTSPGPSGATSPMTSSIVSNGVPEFFQDLHFPRDSTRSTSSDESFSQDLTESGFYSANCTSGNYSFISHASNLQNNNRGNCIVYPGVESMNSTDHDSIMHSSFMSEEYNDTRSLSRNVSSNWEKCRERNPLQFNYESEFEEQLEKQCTENVGSRDDIFSVFNSHESLDMDVQTADRQNAYQRELLCNEGGCAEENGPNNSGDVSPQQKNCGFPQMLQCSDIYQEGYQVHDEATYGDSYWQGPGEVTTAPLEVPNAFPNESEDLLNFSDRFYNPTKYWDDSDNKTVTDTIIPDVSPTGSVSFDFEDIEFIDAESDDDEDNTIEIAAPGRVGGTSSQSVAYQPGSDVVASVQSNLRDKVRKLKQDKEVVDRIVRKAREEQRLRKQELLRIQKQATLARKEILLKTLVGLREQLEQQTDRLQSAYENIITFRYGDALRRRYADIE